MAPVTLAYWDIRGLAQPIRLLLEYTGTDFEDKFFSCGPAPKFDKSCWFDNKFALGLDFPNLPYFVDDLVAGKPDDTEVNQTRKDINIAYEMDGIMLIEDGDCDIKITQSNAILRYIARKNDMLGKTEEEKVRVDMMAEQSMDFRNGIVRLSYNPNFDQLKADYLAKLPSTLKLFSDFLGNGDWFAGANITFVDFVMYELLDQHRIMDPDCLKSYANLTALLDRFEKLPKIEAYIKSNRFMKNPINNKMAKFGFE